MEFTKFQRQLCMLCADFPLSPFHKTLKSFQVTFIWLITQFPSHYKQFQEIKKIKVTSLRNPSSHQQRYGAQQQMTHLLLRRLSSYTTDNIHVLYEIFRTPSQAKTYQRIVFLCSSCQGEGPTHFYQQM